MLFRLLLVAIAAAAAVGVQCPPDTARRVSRGFWITGYWWSPPAWGGLPASEIDYSGLTHIVHYGLLPTSAGGFEKASLGYVTSYAPDLIARAHNNGVRVMLGLVQTGSGGDFTSATNTTHLAAFVANIVQIVDQYGYDGVDLDWETGFVASQFRDLVRALHQEMASRTPRKLLTGAFWTPQYLASMQDYFDQINVMTYDGCSPHDGFTWHNSALYNGGDRSRRAIDTWMTDFLSASVAPEKLGVGVPFYGYKWQGGAGTPTGGVTGPAQTWSVTPTMTAFRYAQLVRDPALWLDSYKRRDHTAGGVPFLSVSTSEPPSDMFITYDDETSIAVKAAYAVRQGFGGIMVYELSGDYLPDVTVKHPLFRALVNGVTGALGYDSSNRCRVLRPVTPRSGGSVH